ncbi:MAG: IPT/TIG domain-containing protein [Planctomycetia bacterium]|nr:IPT/TIG domain-containing protein [Planctomycetia bacterium]
MIAEITGLFGSRLAPRRSRASIRRRRPADRAIVIESLETRKVLNGDTGWIKIDLSQLDQTGVTPQYDIYIQGSANKSGQILQYDPALVTPDGTGGLVFTAPLPSPVTFTSANYTPVSGDSKSITLSTAAQLFVGGSVKFSNGSTSTIASISANVTAGSYTPPASSETPGTWNPAPSGQWTANSNVAIQGASTIPSGTVDGVQLSGANGPVVASSGMSIGSLVVGTLNPGSSQTYFFKNDGNGLPFPSAGNPAQVAQISADSSGIVAATFSATSGQSSLALSPDFLSVFSGGTNVSGFATYVSSGNTVNEVPQGTVQQVTVGDLYSTTQVQPSDLANFDPTSTTKLPIPKSFLTVEGVVGNFPIYGVDSFTITFNDAVPTNAAVTFGTTITANATSATTFTIDASSTGVQGVIDGLSLGLQPTLSQNTQSTKALSISGLALDTVTNTITVTLSDSMPWSSGAMSVDLPPVGGFLPTTKWSATDATSNAIWARQTTDGTISVNGSRIYFSLVTPGDQPPQMAFAQGGGGLTVTQFAPEDIWTGTVPPTQYMELTADSLSPGGDGQIYVDLSAVDGFFFPAALSTIVNNQTIVVGQASGTYVPPPTNGGPTTYSAVSRQEILNAYDAFFTNTTNTSAFASGASALQQAYAGLHIQNAGNSVGLMNPTFLDWSTPSSPAATVLNAAWDNDLNTLFTTSSNQVDLLGDKPSSAWSIVNAIQVADNGLDQGQGYAVGDVITFTTPSSGGRAATAKVKQVQPSNAKNPGGIVSVEITDAGIYPTGDKPTVASISGSGSGAALTVAAMVPATTFYKGVPAAATGTASGSNPNKLVLAEYVGQPVISQQGQYKPPSNFTYDDLYATGAVFTVFDPRTVPASEAQAFNPGTNGGQPTPMAVGQQILGNFGVFSSTATTSDNYTPAGTSPWLSGDALAQLKALQRDIVWALNQGNGGILRASSVQPQPGSTTAYWTNEENWYPYPFITQGDKYEAQTPQNLFAQWVHTAGSPGGGPAIGKDKYFATFPFGNLAGSVPNQDYGQPTRAWGATGAGTGPFMNQTYGFAFDESPPHGITGANVPSKFLPIPNSAGSTQTFQLVFGPWADPAPTVHSITTNPPQSDSTPTPAASTTLSWTVTFSEAVSGVTASNFTSITGNGDASGNVALSSLAVTPSGGSAKTWTVTGTILGAGAGQTTLKLKSNTGITDSAGQALSTSTYDGQTYAYAVPAVTGISQNKGSVNGGTSVTISGTGFNQLSTVKFGTLAASVTYNPAQGGSPATLTAVSPARAAGPVDITVTWNGRITSATSPADTFTYVATSTPVVTASAAPLAADAVTLTILGEHFSPTKAGNTVSLSSGTAIVQSATATSITLLFTSRPTAGLLTATVKTGGASSGAVQVATVYATVTPVTAPIAATAKTLVITGTGFNAKTPANNIVTLSSGAGVVTKATATALTILLTTPPQLGPLSVTSLNVRGVQTSGLPVQVATVVPGPASARSTVTASVAEAAVGTAVTVSLQAIDAVGNPVTTGGARVRFTASSSGTFSKVTDNGDGTYTATFTTKRVGSQLFSATVNGVKVTDTATTAFVFQSQFSQPILGTNWSVARGGFLALFNTAIATATKNNVALYSGAAARNVTVSANVSNLENGQFGGVVARYSSKTSYYQAGLMLESGQYYAVIQAVGVTGVRTLVKQSVVGPGQGLVSFTLSGKSLSLSLNGFQVAQVTDSRFQSGSVGISGGQSVGFTNFFAG